MGTRPYTHKRPQPQNHQARLQHILLVLIVLSILGIVSTSLFIAAQLYLGKTRTGQQPTPSPIVHISPIPSPKPTPTPTPTPTPSPIPSSVLGYPLYRGNSDLAEVALTFDDGPSPTYTPQVLALLKRYGIHATFFVIGSQAAAYPSLVQRDYQQGNIVGNHSWSHPDLTQLPPASILSQLQTTSKAIQADTGVWPTVFRPPYGNINSVIQSIAASLNLSTILWDNDPKDWSRPGTSVIISRVLSSVHNGSIILLHEGGGNRDQTMAALPTIITTLEQRGFDFVTIPQMIQRLGTSQRGPAPSTPQPDFPKSPLTSHLSILLWNYRQGDILLQNRLDGSQDN